jgi:hypothetical protein
MAKRGEMQPESLSGNSQLMAAAGGAPEKGCA